jgi:phage terminase large subunit-like protein
MGQGYMSMAAPTRTFLELVASGRLRHGMNPVLRWMAGNAATESDTRSGEAVLKFSRKKSTEKIDGIMATCMALAVEMVSREVNWYVIGDLAL